MVVGIIEASAAAWVLAPPGGKDETAWKAQHRLHKRFLGRQGASQPHQKIVTAIGRELLGSMWAIGVEADRRSQVKPRALAVSLTT